MKSTWKSWIIAVMMLTASALAVIAKPTVRMAAEGPAIDLETLFPKQFGAWRLDDKVPIVLPSPDVQETIARIYSQVLARTYVNDRGERVMLSVAYGGDQSDDMQVHRPEVCYPAQGFQVLSMKQDRLSLAERTVPVRKLMTRMGSRNEPVLYWIVVGDRVVGSNTEQKLAQLRYGLRGKIPDGMLVRVSTIDGDQERAYRIQGRFLSDLAHAIDPKLRDRVFGGAAPSSAV